MRESSILVTIAITILASLGAAAIDSKKIDAEVAAITKSAILIDTHNDIPSFTVDGTDIGNAPKNHTDIPRLRQGGVGAVFFAAYVDAKYVNGNHSANRTLQMIDTIYHDIIQRYSNDFMLALTADDIERAHRKGKIAALIGIEGGHAIEDSPRLLRDYYRLGVRYMTLTHVNTNNWADSSGDIDDANIAHHKGLTPLGKDIVREMNRLGMMVDISHVADKTFYDALETSEAPLIASHSSCRAVTNAPRNMTDDMIVALAKKGGVIQINFYCNFISQKAADSVANLHLSERSRDLQKQYANDPAKLKAELDALAGEEKRAQVRATLDDVVAHIDHVRQIAGIDAIGIGSDFDGITCAPVGLDDVSKFPNLTRALLEKGYSESDIKKIYGGNTLRLMRQVEKVAASSH
ncbi:MAG: dipeptidase [Acidobacteriaceae bacterium]|nr:dipeptidase [Acidobacteriaceae bacterium]MBV9781415.1 dipeptidase [Acidobacteriaceae bacterium]